MASVTVLVFDVTGLPLVSAMVTAGCVAKATPLAPPPGCVVNTSFVAVPAVMLKLLALLGAVYAWLLAPDAGWLVKASWVAVPAVMLKAELVAPVRPLLDAARV